MATQKPDLTRVWANGAPPANVVDPDTTTPGKVNAGWQAEVPPFEHFNFLQKWFTQGLAHINEQGIAAWDTNTTYPVDGLAKGSDGQIYVAINEQSGNDPVTDGAANWELWANIKSQMLTFKSVQEMLDGNPLRVKVGNSCRTEGYSSQGDGGGATYINRGQGWPVTADGFSDHADTSGNFFELQKEIDGSYLCLAMGFVGGVEDDTCADAWDAMIAGSRNNIKFVPTVASYFFSRQITGRSMLCIFGSVPQDKNRITIAFRSKVANIGSGNALLTCAPSGQQIQSFTCRDIGFLGDLTVDPLNLDLAVDNGFDAFDVSGVKDGLNLSGCAFRQLSAGMNQNSQAGRYTGFSDFTNQSFTLCYRAYRNLSFATGANLSDTKIYDSKVIGLINQFVADNLAINNTSFSGDDAGMLFDRGVLTNPWVEGFNQVFQPQEYLSIQGGWISETKSSTGSNRILCTPAPGATVEISGARLPTNTRLFNLAGSTYEDYFISITGCQNDQNPFGLLSSAISYYLQRGLRFEGRANEKAEYNVISAGESYHFGNKDFSTEKVNPLSVQHIPFVDSIALNINFNDYFDNNPSFRFGFIEFEVVGTNDTGGGNQVYTANIKVVNGFGGTWAAYVDGNDASLFTAVISNISGQTATLTITELHDGIRDILIPKISSGSCRWSVLP